MWFTVVKEEAQLSLKTCPHLCRAALGTQRELRLWSDALSWCCHQKQQPSKFQVLHGTVPPHLPCITSLVKWLEMLIQHNTNCSGSPVWFSSASFQHSGSPFGHTTGGHTETVTTSSGGTITFSEFEIWVCTAGLETRN